MEDQLFKGVEWRRTLEITNSSSGAPVDLTGLDIEVVLKQRPADAALITLTVGAGITLATQSGDTLGQAALVIPGEDTENLESASHRMTVFVDDQVVVAPFKVQVRDA